MHTCQAPAGRARSHPTTGHHCPPPSLWVYHSWSFKKRCYPYMHTHQHCDISGAGLSIFLKKIDCVVLAVVLAGVLFCFNPVTLLKDSVGAWHTGVPALLERHSTHWQTQCNLFLSSLIDGHRDQRFATASELL